MTQLEDELLDLDPGDSLEKGRPSLLTGLCILSWVGCGFSFLTNGYSLVRLAIEGNLSGAFLPANYLLLQLATMSLLMVCAIGVYGMWKLKKWGFFVYVAGEILPILISFYYIYQAGSALEGIGFSSFIFSLSGIIAFIIPVVFIILYGTNYKHLQ